MHASFESPDIFASNIIQLNAGGNALDTFDPGPKLYVSAGKTISASQFTFPVDASNDSKSLLFGMQSSEVKTTITGRSIATPAGSNTHFHLKVDGNSNPIGVFVKSNSILLGSL